MSVHIWRHTHRRWHVCNYNHRICLFFCVRLSNSASQSLLCSDSSRLEQEKLFWSSFSLKSVRCQDRFVFTVKRLFCVVEWKHEKKKKKKNWKGDAASRSQQHLRSALIKLQHLTRSALQTGYEDSKTCSLARSLASKQAELLMTSYVQSLCWQSENKSKEGMRGSGSAFYLLSSLTVHKCWIIIFAASLVHCFGLCVLKVGQSRLRQTTVFTVDGSMIYCLVCNQPVNRMIFTFKKLESER